MSKKMGDVKQSQHLNRGRLGTTITWGIVILTTIAFFEFRIRPGFYDFNARVKQAVDNQVHPERADVLLRSQYTGVLALDYALRYMVVIHLPPFAGFVELYFVQLAYLVVSVAGIISIYTVEAGRKGCSTSSVRYISLWTLFYTAIGGAVGLPIWFLAFLRHSAQIDTYGPLPTQLPLPYAKALLPAHLLGYLWSAVTVLYPFEDPRLAKKQLYIAIWLTSTFTVNLLLAIFTKFFQLISNEEVRRSSSDDTVYVKTLYALWFFPSAVAHMVLLYISTHAHWTLSDVFFPKPDLMKGSLSEMVYYIFVLDFAVMFIVALWTAFLVIVDLQIMGRSSLSRITVATVMILSTYLIGPAATILAAWWWREDMIRLVSTDVRKDE